MKVLHCITDLSPDGAQRTLLRLVSGMNRGEFRNRIVSLMPGGHLTKSFESAGVEVVHLGMKRGLPGLRTLSNLRAAVREFAPDVLQGWMYHGNIAALAGARLAGSPAPVVWNIRRALYDVRRDKALTRGVIALGARLSRFADAIIYCVGVAAEQHQRIGFSNSRAVIIPNGFDTNRFSPDRADREGLRAELGLPVDALVAGIVGRYHPQKDYPTFFRAARAASERMRELHFVMIGRGVTRDNPEADAFVRDLGLEGRVVLLGERQDVPRILASLDLFVSSSENEGFSNVVGEAMASGVPCVATDAGASKELLEGLGVVVNRGDYRALADGIIETMGLSPEIRGRISLEVRSRIVGNYSLDSMIASYEGLYRRLVANEGPELKRAA